MQPAASSPENPRRPLWARGLDCAASRIRSARHLQTPLLQRDVLPGPTRPQLPGCISGLEASGAAHPAVWAGFLNAPRRCVRLGSGSGFHASLTGGDSGALPTGPAVPESPGSRSQAPLSPCKATCLRERHPHPLSRASTGSTRGDARAHRGRRSAVLGICIARYTRSPKGRGELQSGGVCWPRPLTAV